jgi:hypothetical protein
VTAHAGVEGRPGLRCALAALALAAAVTGSAQPVTAPAPASTPANWTFQVLLDDKPIGQHSFSRATAAESTEMTIEASFEVKLLGITVYRYQHRNVERWSGDCLQSLTAETNDDGKLSRVSTRKDGTTLVVASPLSPQSLGGCVMSFAYWNPAMLKQTQLLNSQTGRYEKVRIEALGSDTLTTPGRSITADHFRIVGTEQPIDLWYTPAGDWVALASTVSGGKRKLSYRRL